MSIAQRTLFVLFALAAAGGVGFLVLEMQKDAPSARLDLGEPGPRVAPPSGTPRGAGPGPSAPILRSGARPDEGDTERTSLTVLVVDDRGRPLPEATIELLGEEGARVEGRGSLEWTEASPGPWALTVEAEGVLPFRSQVVVEAGARARVTAQLRDHVRLEGRVLDLLGRPVEDQRVWALAEGQGHPATNAEIKDRPNAASSRTGEFTLRAPGEGTWRVSVGPPGEELARSAALDLHLGGPTELEIVIARGGMLRVEMDHLSPGLQEGRVVLRVAVLKRRKIAATDESVADVDGPRGREGGRRARAEPEDPATVARPEAAPDPSLDAWKEVAIAPLDREGRAAFDELPLGPDLRLVFKRKSDRFESEIPFVLLEGQVSVARFSLPTKRTPEEIAAQPVGAFYPAILAETESEGMRAGIRLVE